jgi:hypothetical protein
VRCPYCGNENPDDHRFCGMCGRAIPEPTAESPLPVPGPVRHRDPEPSPPAPAYTGGIFNLNAPADHTHRNLDYLLDDDEEPRSSKTIIFLFFLALALVAGLGYLRWRNGGVPWLKSLTSSSKPVPTAPDATENSPAADQSTSPQTAQPAPAPPVATVATPAPSPAATAPITPAQPPSPAATPESSPATSANSTNSAAPADSKPSATPPANTAPAVTDANAPAAEKAAEAPAPSAPAPRPKAKPASKPAPKPAAKASDQVSLGEQYLYGRGVPQNCERGLRYVKPAADQSNPRAMITMGALYATGHCLSRDLPTAYRFFALALRGDPENAPLRQNAEMVWKQMTAEERKQAIRLTQ